MNNSTKTGLLRLARLKEYGEATAEEMKHEAGRFDRLRAKEPAKAYSAFNLFQTPEHIADRMANMLGDVTGKKILEPSAGLGRLCRAVGGGIFTMVEQDRELCSYLFKNFRCPLVHADFLDCDEYRLGGLFDYAIMNPPFKNGRDVKHIRHAYGLLKPGGLLVSLCFNGARQNKQLRHLVDSFEVLPVDSFKSEGTRASVALVTWKKPLMEDV